MRNLFDIESPIIQWVTKISLLLWMNTLWFVCCLPVVTVGASTAAFYRMTFNLREEKECSAKAFFAAFRENFKQATLIWLLLLAAAVVLVLGYYFAMYIEQDMVRLGVVLALCVLFLLWGFSLLYSFPLTCYFENTLKGTIRNAVGMSIRHLRQTVVCFAIAVVPAVALMISGYWFLRLLYIWILFYPGLAAYWIAGIHGKSFAVYAGAEGKEETE